MEEEEAGELQTHTPTKGRTDATGKLRRVKRDRRHRNVEEDDVRIWERVSDAPRRDRGGTGCTRRRHRRLAGRLRWILPCGWVGARLEHVHPGGHARTAAARALEVDRLEWIRGHGTAPQRCLAEIDKKARVNPLAGGVAELVDSQSLLLFGRVGGPPPV